MAQVSVLGLGAMGSTLARVLLDRGHDVTVWEPQRLGGAAAVAAAGAASAATKAGFMEAAALAECGVPPGEPVAAMPGLGSLMAGAFVEYCRRAQAAGEGGEDIAALFKSVKRPAAEPGS